MSFSNEQKKLVRVYLADTLLFGLAFLLLYRLLLVLHWAPKYLITYLPLVVGGVIAIYLFNFRNEVRRVHFKGAGKSTVPTLFFLSMMVVPWAPLNWLASSTEQIEELLSVKSVSEAHSPFLHFTNLDARKTLVIDDVTVKKQTDEDGFVSTNFNYTGLVPIAATPEDRIVSAWMVIQEQDAQNDDLTAEEIRKFKDDLLQRGHARALHYPYDSIRFFTVVNNARYREILNQNGLPIKDPVFLHASLDTLSDYRMIFVQIFGWSYVGLSLFFLGAVAFGHYEAIDND